MGVLALIPMGVEEIDIQMVLMIILVSLPPRRKAKGLRSAKAPSKRGLQRIMNAFTSSVSYWMGMKSSSGCKLQLNWDAYAVTLQ